MPRTTDCNVCDLLTSIQAVFVRLLFLGHSLFAIWAATCVTGRPELWALTALCALFIIETIVSIVKRKGREMKWFSLCVLIYLLSVVPPIWLLNIDLFSCVASTLIDENGDDMGCTGITGSNSTICAMLTLENYFDRRTLVYVVQQVMLLLLIIGRWLLPQGSISRDQLSLLLLVYFGITFDIMELFYLFDEKAVLGDFTMQYVILAIWSVSLLQFTIVLTVTKRQRARLSRELRGGRGVFHRLTGCQCCQSEIWSLLTSVILQDGPFLCLRIYCLAGLGIFSQSLVFYTVKNALVVILQSYRLIVLILRCTKPGFDDRPVPKAPSVTILSSTVGSGSSRNVANNSGNSRSAASVGWKDWVSERSQSVESVASSTDRLDRSRNRTMGSQDFIKLSHV